nr:hypothetical protein [Tanacetum cinerariifolium]
MIMNVHNESRLSMSRNRATVKTLVIMTIHMTHQVNGAQDGYNCPSQVPFIQTLPSFPQQYPCCGDCGETESDEFIKSSVENLIPNLSKSGDLSDSESNVPACDHFTTFSNLLFDADDDFSSNLHHFNVESVLIESLLNYDSSVISFSSKIDFLLDEFAGELILLKLVPPGIDETDCDPKEEIRLIEKLLYDNSSPRPPEGFISENSDAAIESFSPFPITVEDSDSSMEEIYLSFTPDDSMPPGIEEDDYDSERDMLIFKEFLSNDSLSLPKNESFHFDIPSFLSPPAKPPNDDSRILTVKVVGDSSELYIPMPRLLPTQPTLVSNQKKSPRLLSHQGLKASQLHSESPVMIYGGNTPILDVLFLHFYPLDQLKYGGNWVKLSDPKQALRGRHPMLILSF